MPVTIWTLPWKYYPFLPGWWEKGKWHTSQSKREGSTSPRGEGDGRGQKEGRKMIFIFHCHCIQIRSALETKGRMTTSVIWFGTGPWEGHGQERRREKIGGTEKERALMLTNFLLKNNHAKKKVMKTSNIQFRWFIQDQKQLRWPGPDVIYSLFCPAPFRKSPVTNHTSLISIKNRWP